jgi:hypothetical protein
MGGCKNIEGRAVVRGWAVVRTSRDGRLQKCYGTGGWKNIEGLMILGGTTDDIKPHANGPFPCLDTNTDVACKHGGLQYVGDLGVSVRVARQLKQTK